MKNEKGLKIEKPDSWGKAILRPIGLKGREF